jgi:hypothetical protein
MRAGTGDDAMAQSTGAALRALSCCAPPFPLQHATATPNHLTGSDKHILPQLVKFRGLRTFRAQLAEK